MSAKTYRNIALMLAGIIFLWMFLFANGIVKAATEVDTFRVNASNRDCRSIATTFSNNAGTSLAGKAGSDACDCAFQFRIDIAAGRSITSVYALVPVSGAGANDTATTIATAFKFEVTDNATAIANEADFEARTRTTAKVDWDIAEDWNESSSNTNTWKTSPDLVTPFREVYDAVDYDSADYFTLYWYDDGAVNERSKSVYTYDIGTDFAAILVVTHTDAAVTYSGTKMVGVKK